MTLVEAQALKARLDLDAGLHNTVVRILPESSNNPAGGSTDVGARIVAGDNGYDVETTIHGIESTQTYD